MALQRFDELNSMATKWFSVMQVSEEEKKKRVELSLDYCEIMIMLFLMITEQEAEKEDCIAFTRERLTILAENLIGKENIAYINDWAIRKATEIVNLTYSKYENEIEDASIEDEEEEQEETDAQETEKDEKPKVKKFEELDIEVPEKEYWTSDERALLLGINLASTVTNYQELSDAIDKGHNRKVWITEADDKVRPTHDAVHGEDIPINDLFLVGDSYMLMPGDANNGAEEKEIDNCRCHLMTYKK